MVYLELPEVGRVLKAGDTFGTVESVKAVSELYAPVAGEVVEVHSDLVANPEAIVVRHNVAFAQETGRFDPAYLSGLSDDAVPTLVAALPTLDPARSTTSAMLASAKPCRANTSRAASSSARSVHRTTSDTKKRASGNCS